MCFVVLRKRETACGPLWAARSVRRPSRGGNRVLCDFHAGGTVHGLFRSSTTADDAPGATIACEADPWYSPQRAWRTERAHAGAFVSRRVSGSRMVGPFSVSRARDGSAGRRSHRRRSARQSPRATRSAAADWQSASTPFTPIFNDFEEVPAFGVGERREEPIIDRQEIELGEFRQEPGIAIRRRD